MVTSSGDIAAGRADLSLGQPFSRISSEPLVSLNSEDEKPPEVKGYTWRPFISLSAFKAYQLVLLFRLPGKPRAANCRLIVSTCEQETPVRVTRSEI
jgi:hypothetical protein